MNVDFKEVKATVSFKEAVRRLGLKLDSYADGKQLHGQCPSCDKLNSPARSLIVTETSWECLHTKKKGSVLDLAMHVLDCDLRAAALRLLQQPEEEEVKPVVQKGGFNPKKYQSDLQTEHDLLTKSGLTPEVCRARAIGVASKGSHKGLIAVPTIDFLSIRKELFDEIIATGKLMWVGVPEVHLPKVKP